MKKGIIRRESEVRDNKMYYKVMIKEDSIFSSWREEYGSFKKEDAEEMFSNIAGASNIRVVDN